MAPAGQDRSGPGPSRRGSVRGRRRIPTLGSDEVRVVLASGRSVPGARVVLYLRPAGGPTPRAAFVASKRIGGAVDRNRARRILREAWRELAPRARHDPSPAAGCDVVLVARAGIRGAKTQDLVNEVRELLGRMEGSS